MPVALKIISVLPDPNSATGVKIVWSVPGTFLYLSHLAVAHLPVKSAIGRYWPVRLCDAGQYNGLPDLRVRDRPWGRVFQFLQANLWKDHPAHPANVWT